MGLEDDINALQTLDERMRSQQAKAVSDRGKLSDDYKAKIAEIKSHIKKGNFSGNTIRDFMIVGYEVLGEPKIEEKIRALQTQIEANKGQQVLVVDQRCRLEREARGGCMGGTPAHYDSNMVERLGVLNGELGFDLGKEPALLVPTLKHTRRGNMISGRFHRSDDNWSFDKGPIRLRARSIWDVPVLWLENPLKYNEQEGETIRVIAGNNDVERYFRSNRAWYWMFYNEFKEGKLPKEDFETTLDERVTNTEYIRALRFIGFKGPADLEKAYDKSVHESRVDVFKGLQERLSAVEDKQADVTKKYAENGKNLGGVFERGIDDWRKALGDKDYGLSERISSVQDILKNAVELGMHEGNLRLIVDGVDVEASRNVLRLCSQYKVDIKG